MTVRSQRAPRPPPPAWQSVAALAAIAAAVAATAVAGASATGPGVDTFYANLDKPAWAPPGTVFAPVWTVLYVLMAAAAWLVWRAGGARAWGALTLFAVKLVLNALWPLLFFGAQRPALALAEVVVLLAAVAGTASAFVRWSRVAGALFLPYLVWVAFAAALNAAIVGLGA